MIYVQQNQILIFYIALFEFRNSQSCVVLYLNLENQRVVLHKLVNLINHLITFGHEIVNLTNHIIRLLTSG